MSQSIKSIVFKAKDFPKALQMREDGLGIIRRTVHPTMGVIYEVILIPKEKIEDINPYKDI